MFWIAREVFWIARENRIYYLDILKIIPPPLFLTEKKNIFADLGFLGSVLFWTFFLKISPEGRKKFGEKICFVQKKVWAVKILISTYEG